MKKQFLLVISLALATSVVFSETGKVDATELASEWVEKIPANPTDFKAYTCKNSNTIEFEWANNSYTEATFVIEELTETGWTSNYLVFNHYLIANTVTTSAELIDTPHRTEGPVKFRIKALNKTGCSDYAYTKSCPKPSELARAYKSKLIEPDKMASNTSESTAEKNNQIAYKGDMDSVDLGDSIKTLLTEQAKSEKQLIN